MGFCPRVNRWCNSARLKKGKASLRSRIYSRNPGLGPRQESRGYAGSRINPRPATTRGFLLRSREFVRGIAVAINAMNFRQVFPNRCG